MNALPEGSRLLAINEARRAPIRHPVALASVFDRQPVRPFLRGAADGAAVERALAQAGFTHVLVNEFEQVRLLRMHTPPALLGAVRFQALLAMAPPAGVDAVLAGEFAGYTEFAADPLSDAERAAYLDFLRRLRGRAVWQTSSVSPAAWIAQLEPNGE